MKSLVILVFVIIASLQSSLAENYITQSDAHHANSDDTTFGTVHQHELNYAAVWGDDNHLTQDNAQYAKGTDIDQSSTNELLIVGNNNYVQQSNQADAPKEDESSLTKILQTQWNLLAIIGDYNSDQTNPIVQSNYAHAINEATDAWVNQVQSNKATVLGTENYLVQTNNADVSTTIGTTDTNQVQSNKATVLGAENYLIQTNNADVSATMIANQDQKNLALLIGTSSQFTLPKSPEKSPIVNIDEFDSILLDPKIA